MGHFLSTLSVKVLCSLAWLSTQKMNICHLTWTWVARTLLTQLRKQGIEMMTSFLVNRDLKNRWLESVTTCDFTWTWTPDFFVTRPESVFALNDLRFLLTQLTPVQIVLPWDLYILHLNLLQIDLRQVWIYLTLETRDLLYICVDWPESQLETCKYWRETSKD